MAFSSEKARGVVMDLLRRMSQLHDVHGADAAEAFLVAAMVSAKLTGGRLRNLQYMLKLLWPKIHCSVEESDGQMAPGLYHGEDIDVVGRGRSAEQGAADGPQE